jgi:hypothetical protein
MFAMKPAREKGLSTIRIVSIIVSIFLLTAGNVLFAHMRTSSMPLLESLTDTVRHLRLLDPDSVEQLGNFGIHVYWHPKNRSQRFPSVDERVKLYMSNWYLPPCRDTSIGKFAGKYQRSIMRLNGSNESWPVLNISDAWDSNSSKTMTIDSLVLPDRKILLHRATIEDCARSNEQYSQQGKLPTESRIIRRPSMNTYCSPVVELMNIMDQLDHGDDDTPILTFFGDGGGLRGKDSFEIPLISKHRAGTTKDYITKVTGGNLSTELCWKEARRPLETAYHQDLYRNRLSPILWKLELIRHWNPLPGALRVDTPWEQKKNGAFWGGDLTGNSQGKTDLERCLSNQRCRFVLDHAGSKLIDARATKQLRVLKNSTTVNGIELKRKSVGIDIIQQYKVIICLEGNDVSSGLKWMLQSMSVVLMPPPTRTSWAMEELLEPWVHYIPMLPDGSNAEEMVQWALDNEKEARRIAERATLFIYDLVYHPDAESDDRKIKEEMAQRYRALWH